MNSPTEHACKHCGYHVHAPNCTRCTAEYRREPNHWTGLVETRVCDNPNCHIEAEIGERRRARGEQPSVEATQHTLDLLGFNDPTVKITIRNPHPVAYVGFALWRPEP